MNTIVKTQRVYDLAKCGAKTIDYLQHQYDDTMYRLQHLLVEWILLFKSDSYIFIYPFVQLPSQFHIYERRNSSELYVLDKNSEPDPSRVETEQVLKFLNHHVILEPPC